ncbi:chaplin family protein [Streptomyces coeruleorubidus]
MARAGTASAGSDPVGIATDSPGFLSGTSINAIGLLNPAFGNECPAED